eukprot:tig00020572_g11578.t1
MIDLQDGRLSLSLRSSDSNPRFLAPASQNAGLTGQSSIFKHSTGNPDADIVPQRQRERPVATESSIRRKRRSLSRSRRYVSGDSDDRGEGIYDGDREDEEDEEAFFPMADLISKLKLGTSTSIQSLDQTNEAALADSTIGFSASLLNLSGILGASESRQKPTPRKLRAAFRRRLAPRAYYPPDRSTLISSLRAASPSHSLSSSSSAVRGPRALRASRTLRRSPSISRRRAVLAARTAPVGAAAAAVASIPLSGSWCPPLSNRTYTQNAQSTPYIEAAFCLAPSRYDFSPLEKLSSIAPSSPAPSAHPGNLTLSLSHSPSPAPSPFLSAR